MARRGRYPAPGLVAAWASTYTAVISLVAAGLPMIAVVMTQMPLNDILKACCYR
jgi:hypothetical protein